MKLTEVLCVLERVAPVALSDEFCRVYKLYDNSGIIIDCGAESRACKTIRAAPSNIDTSFRF